MAKKLGIASINPAENACCGSLCRYAVSTAGHDAGKIYLVVGAVPGGNACGSPAAYYLADGRIRGIASPKRKNALHVRLLPARDEALASKLCAGERITDAELVYSLKCFKRSQAAGSGSEI